MRKSRKSSTTKASIDAIAKSGQDNRKTVVRNKARVTVSKKSVVQPVRKRTNVVHKRGRNSIVTTSVFPKKFLDEAKAALRPNEKLVVLSSTEARTVYIKD